VKGLYDRFARADEVKQVIDVAEPESVEEISFVLLRRIEKLDGDPHETFARDGAVIVRTNKPREWKALAAAAQVPVAKATHAGKDYYRMSGDTPVAFGFLPLDEKTIVLASESNLKQIIDTNKGAGPAVGSSADGGAQTVAVARVDVAWLRGLVAPVIASDSGMSLSMAVVRPVWEKTDRVIVRIEAGDAEGFALGGGGACAGGGGGGRAWPIMPAPTRTARSSFSRRSTPS